MAKFTHEDAKRLIDKMRRNYGKRFADQWVGVTPDELAEEMVDQYQGLLATDFLRGIDRMKREEWPPTVPAFRSWCESQSNGGIGANEAWNIARNSIDFNGYELTVVWTKECAVAFDAVVGMVRLGDKYQIAEAKKVFVERYERLVTESLERGEKPVYEVSYGDDKEQRKTALREAEVAGLLPSGTSQFLIETIQTPNDADAESKKFKSIAQEHLAKLKSQLKTHNVKIEAEDKADVKLFKLPEKLDCWADPFEETEKYKQILMKEGKPIPMAVRQRNIVHSE